MDDSLRELLIYKNIFDPNTYFFSKFYSIPF